MLALRSCILARKHFFEIEVSEAIQMFLFSLIASNHSVLQDQRQELHFDCNFDAFFFQSRSQHCRHP